MKARDGSEACPQRMYADFPHEFDFHGVCRFCGRAQKPASIVDDLAAGVAKAIVETMRTSKPTDPWRVCAELQIYCESLGPKPEVKP